MARDKLDVKEKLSAVIMRPRAIQRLHEKVECAEGKKDVDRHVKEDLDVKKGGTDAN